MALGMLSGPGSNAAAIAAAGAIEPMVRLLAADFPADVQANAAGALGFLAKHGSRPDISRAIVAACASAGFGHQVDQIFTW